MRETFEVAIARVMIPWCNLNSTESKSSQETTEAPQETESIGAMNVNKNRVHSCSKRIGVHALNDHIPNQSPADVPNPVIIVIGHHLISLGFVPVKSCTHHCSSSTRNVLRCLETHVCLLQSKRIPLGVLTEIELLIFTELLFIRHIILSVDYAFPVNSAPSTRVFQFGFRFGFSESDAYGIEVEFIVIAISCLA